jgi:hypothetical protein
MILTAQSDVFQRMFLTDCEEARTGILKISDISAESMESMLQYLHMGRLDKPQNATKELLVAADKYIIKSLVVIPYSPFLVSRPTVLTLLVVH